MSKLPLASLLLACSCVLTIPGSEPGATSSGGEDTADDPGDTDEEVNPDNDDDGWRVSEDCDDDDPEVNPGAEEICGDEVDNDCSDGDAVCDAVEVHADDAGMQLYSMGTAGETIEVRDLDGDGSDDLLVADDDDTISGSVAFIAYGPLSGDTNLFVDGDVAFTTRRPYEQLGSTLHSGGDLNGDGASDIVIGMRDYATEGEPNQPGAAFLFYGSGGRLDAEVSMEDDHDVMWTGALRNGQFGSSVRAVGDLNGDGLDGTDSTTHTCGGSMSNAGDSDGDGLDELAIGCPDKNVNGMAFVVPGATSRLTGEVGLGDAAIASIKSETEDPLFGYNVRGVGDMDGDGLDDLAVGALDTGNTYSAYRNSVTLYYGPLSGAMEAGQADAVAYGHQDSTNGGWMGAGIASGDLDGDGDPDLVVSDILVDVIYVFNGVDW